MHRAPWAVEASEAPKASVCRDCASVNPGGRGDHQTHFLRLGRRAFRFTVGREARVGGVASAAGRRSYYVIDTFARVELMGFPSDTALATRQVGTESMSLGSGATSSFRHVACSNPGSDDVTQRTPR